MDRRQKMELVRNLLNCENYSSLSALVNRLYSLLFTNLHSSASFVCDLIDPAFLAEIKEMTCLKHVHLFFAESLRELKCVISEDEGMRFHELKIHYKGPKKLRVSAVALPHSALLDREYNSIMDIVTSFEQHLGSLSSYFYELERIDRFCTVMEPTKPSFKDNYRNILLDDRTWLHVEITPKGYATNIHLLGHSEQWNDKLQAGLLNWDHDKDIVENITTVFDIMNFPTVLRSPCSLDGTDSSDEAVCSICLCAELPNVHSVPQPLCQNPECVVYFHRNCLFQWLVACSGGRPPAFGVASGTCPTCLEPTTCSANDT